MVKLAGVKFESFVDAEGVSCVLFISGCRHDCLGCHSPETHDFGYGLEITDEVISRINQEIDKRPFLNALVLSGGDPMYSAKELLDILPKIHIPNNNIWIYSGFKFDQIKQSPHMLELLRQCKCLVDGKFEIDKRDVTLRFKGSSNQRLIDVQESLKQDKVVIYNS